MNFLERYSLAGKVAVVTGAARGLGEGYAHGLAAAGAKVVCADINTEGAEKTAAAITAEGGRAQGIFLDVTNPSGVSERFERIAAELGSLDILVNNAGVEDINDFVSVTEEQYDKIMGVNLRGVFFTSQAAAKIMIRQNRGKIVNIGSLGSAIGLSQSSVYCGTKGGVVQITKTMAIELAKYNIQVNAMGPGYFRTPMTEPFFQDPEHRKWIEERIPAGRVGTADDLLGTLVFLSSSASDYLTGQIVYIDGGWLAS
ncbi:SDR family NAD(P)-dependent oxidoreductase [Aminivibrio sp.]|jgi:NAD(P)-dependent dehydrogenase (short-subunit alcohol dehydrogenase family)|uniref:SDR family NAD(P)-dependent oxidoreductase n=1 Tax=Aminivibrio sp. TaxID=1872489 RepID=UPI003D9517C8